MFQFLFKKMNIILGFTLISKVNQRSHITWNSQMWTIRPSSFSKRFRKRTLRWISQPISVENFFESQSVWRYFSWFSQCDLSILFNSILLFHTYTNSSATIGALEIDGSKWWEQESERTGYSIRCDLSLQLLVDCDWHVGHCLKATLWT